MLPTILVSTAAGYDDFAMAVGHLVKADRGDTGRRVDLVLLRHLSTVANASRTEIQRWIRNGHVTLNGAPVYKTSTRTAAGDLLSVDLPVSETRVPIQPEHMPLDIVYEDEHFLVVNKPAGLVAHPTYGHLTGTLMNALLWHAREWPAGQRPSLVGRLDKETSGALVVAKTRSVHATLQRLMSSSQCRKEYLAVVYGRMKVRHARIRLRLGRERGDRRRVVAGAERGLASETLVDRLGVARAPAVGLSLLRCRLVTGRMHQIRVHLAAQAWPIVGDAKYGRPRWIDILDPQLKAVLQAFPRQALHAWRITMPHPVARTLVAVEARIPQDISALLNIVGLAAPDH